MKFDAVYYEPDSLNYELGRELKEKYAGLPWFPIASHNSIKEMQEKPNSEFGKMKRNLIIGIRKTHKYVENHKVSDYLVPYTSSGCTAMCLYCYLVCNYNKCAYLRLFVNREQMLDRIIKKGKDSSPLVFEIGSNSDLVLENTITDNLEVSEAELEEAFNSVDEHFIEVIKKAKENIFDYHKHQVKNSFIIAEKNGVVLGQKVTPLQRAGIYVPGGTAAYPSTVLMNIVPAKIAGVKEIIMTSPAKDKSCYTCRCKNCRGRQNI